jgi:hypothetical protein
MSYVLQDLMMRDLTPRDIVRITGLVSRVMTDGPVARWLFPDPETRRRTVPGYAEVLSGNAVDHGEVSGIRSTPTTIGPSWPCARTCRGTASAPRSSTVTTPVSTAPACPPIWKRPTCAVVTSTSDTDTRSDP